MPSTTTSPIRQLVDIISSTVSEIETILEKQDVDYPRLDEPFVAGSQAETATMAPDVAQCAALVVAACGQLSATLGSPASTLFGISAGFHVASALNVALEGNTVEILRSHPEGLSVNEIAAQNGINSVRLARILRLLATNHIFIESSPNVFRNNRLSSLLDTMKSVEEIKAKPEDKHVGTPGVAAIVQHTCDEVFKGSAYMSDVLTDPVMGHSEDPRHAPLAVALKMNKSCWEWFEEPENEYRLKRFSAAMGGTARLDPPNAIDLGFKWGDLPPNSVIVDVGGGLGHITMKLLQYHPNLKYIVQDRPPVIDQAHEFWQKNLPSAINNGSVTLQAHDFFTPQLVTQAAVFMCRAILHDYGRNKATSILRHLREAASQETRLLLIDTIMPYACLDEGEASSIPGAKRPSPPEPLLANLGGGNAAPYLLDLQMMVALNGEERTLGTWIELTTSTGWNIIEIFPVPSSIHQQILAVPV